MKLEINVPDVCYENILNGEMDSLDVRYGLEAIKHGTSLPEGAEILTKEAYSDLCLRASQERKTGKWIFGSTLGHSWMKCSECCVSQDGQTACFTYCPNCGAKMEGAEE